jgi:hypothetical protein
MPSLKLCSLRKRPAPPGSKGATEGDRLAHSLLSQLS